MAVTIGQLLVFVFYSLLIIVIYLNRKKFEFQGKIVALLRTNTGLKWMMRYGKKHKKLIRVVASIGVFISYFFMLFIVAYLIYGLYTTFFIPGSPPVISPVLPGIKIPGSPFALPLIEGLIALFVSILVHEASHGLVAASYGMKVKSSGLFLMGPIPGAFVEPDEKKLIKSKPWTQLSVYAAGPWSNILLAIALLGVSVLLTNIFVGQTQPQGIMFQAVEPGSPADLARIPVNTTFVAVDNNPVSTTRDFISSLKQKEPGDTLVLSSANSSYNITLGKYDINDGVCLGVSGIKPDLGSDDIRTKAPFLSSVYLWIMGLIIWIIVISSGLGLANMMPLGPVDGGRMLQITLRKFLPDDKADSIWTKISILVLVIVIILVVVPIIKALFTAPAVASCIPV